MASVSERTHDATQPRFSYVVARLDRALRAAIGQCVKPHGLTTSQYTTLSILGAKGGLSNAQLARRAYITPQSTNEVIDVLEERGLLERKAHPNHGRVLPLALTRKGRRVLAACDEAVAALEEEMLQGLTGRERGELTERLASAVRALHAGFPLE
jgi:DNA-binding MarR family transcriptional regulator